MATVQSSPKINYANLPNVSSTKVDSTSSTLDQNKGTYYLTKNKSSKISQRQYLRTIQNSEIAATSIMNQTQSFLPRQSARHNELFGEKESTTKAASYHRRHVSQIQDRIHQKNMKNLQIIQQQIQTNTNLTKNRLAINKSSEPVSGQGQSPS